jgi:cobalt-zinc-cadmium efflux system outer membrane protein
VASRNLPEPPALVESVSDRLQLVSSEASAFAEVAASPEVAATPEALPATPVSGRSGQDTLKPALLTLASALEIDEPEDLPEPGQEAAPRVTLNEVIARCLEQDPLLRAGFQEIAFANADLITASLKPNPELEIVQSLLPLIRPFEADIREGGPPQFDVMLAYPIDWYLFGKRAAAMRSAAGELAVSRAEYADLVRQRVLEAGLAYYDVVEAQALRELAAQDVENLELVEQITQTAVDNGAMPRVELSRIKLDRLNSQQTLREAERDLQVAKAALLAVVGGRLSGDVGRDRNRFQVVDHSELSLEPSDLSVWLGTPQQAFEFAQANRPDLQSLNLRVSQTLAEIEAQRTEAYPEVTPMMGYTHQFQRRAIGQPDADSWGVGLAMTLPVNNRNQGNRYLAAAQWRQANQLLQAGLIELRSEVEQVTAALEAARINAAAIAEEQLALAEEVRDSIRKAYEAGGRPLIDVLDSQRNYRETFGNYIGSRVDLWRAILEFNATLGSEVIP